MRKFYFEKSQIKPKLFELLSHNMMDNATYNTTYFGENRFLPVVNDENYIVKALKDEFKKFSELDCINQLNDVEGLQNRYNILLSKCQEIERDNRDKLEKICMNIVIDLFKIPEDLVTLNLSLVDKIDLHGENVIFEPNIDNDIFDCNDKFEDKVNKRQILLALACGCGLKKAFDIDLYANEVSKIDPKLPDMYFELMSLNQLLLYIKDDCCITDKSNKQIGLSILKLGNSKIKTNVVAQGLIFPVLLAEAVRCIVELFISHGLPQDKHMALQILNRTDFIKNDIWLMRIGMNLWDVVYGPCKNLYSVQIPYFMKNLSTLEINRFNAFMSGSIERTPEWKDVMFKLIHKSQQDADKCKRLDKLTKQDIDKEIIMDDYIHPDDL